MEDIRQILKKIIESEYKKAIEAGLIDSSKIAEKIWNILIEKNVITIPAPEPAYGCYENSEEEFLLEN
jgi:hypothetical protein